MTIKCQPYNTLSAMKTYSGHFCRHHAFPTWVIGLVVILYVQISLCADDTQPFTSRRSGTGDVPAFSSRRTSAGETYTSRRTTKTVLTRPAMRIYRYRPSSRNRVPRPTIYRRPVSHRVVTEDANIPGLRRVVWSDGGGYRSSPRSTADTTNNATTHPPTPTTTSTTSTTDASQTTRAAISIPTTTHVETKTKSTGEDVTTATTKVPATTSSESRATTRQSTKQATPRRPIYSRRKLTRYRDLPYKRLNKDINFNELMKKLDFFIAYYPSVREAAARLSTMMSKYEQNSREERRRIWKGVFRVKSDLRRVNAKCDAIHRNVTIANVRLSRQSRNFESYQQANQRKIGDIEKHQGTQDDQYYDLFQKFKNNSNEIQRVTTDMAVLLPLVGNLMENYERNNLQEKRALEMLDSHARGNIAEMTSQILVQQNTLENLGNQVRSEMDDLHEEKQSMAKRMEQHQRRLTETVNTHLSSHVQQINKIEGSLNRQSENMKYVSKKIGQHGDMLESNQALVLAFMDQIANASEGLDKMKLNITQFMRNYKDTKSDLSSTKQTVSRLEENTRQLASSLNRQHEVIGDTMERVNMTEQVIRSVSHELDAYKVKQDAETEDIREDLDDVLARQRAHQENITTLFSSGEPPLLGMGGTNERFLDHYPSDEPAPAGATVTPQELRALLTEIGVEDRMSRFARVLRHQQQRMSNVTRAVLRLADDNEAITATTSHYFNLIGSQAKVIKDQNETISKLAMIAAKQGDTIKTLSSELSTGQETVMKLTNILVNMATQMKNPMGSQRDCHDVWLNGNKKSGVYNIIENMKLRPVQCNMTDYGGWTIIQRRNDGSRDFDRTMKEYEEGFGDIYGEHWLGLESIKTYTQMVRASVGLQIVMEDWDGNVRKATYSQFYIYGKMYKLSLGGYSGDAGDSLVQSNGLPFTAKNDHNDFTGGTCSQRRNSGWWFTLPSTDCGDSNLNGVYRKGPTQDARILSTIYWKRWHGVGYPLKSVTMQVIPTSVINQMREAEREALSQSSQELNGHASQEINEHESSPSGVNGHSNTDDSAYQRNVLNDNPYDGESNNAQTGGSSATPYDAGAAYLSDYDNFDYNALFNDG